MQAKSRDEFISAWQRRVNEFAALVPASNPSDVTFAAEYQNYTRIRGDLCAMIERAANREFPKQEPPPKTDNSLADELAEQKAEDIASGNYK